MTSASKLSSKFSSFTDCGFSPSLIFFIMILSKFRDSFLSIYKIGLKDLAILIICSSYKSGMTKLSSLCSWLASFFISFKFEENIVDSKYSNALPFPVMPKFVRVDAGKSPRRTSSALDLIVAL